MTCSVSVERMEAVAKLIASLQDTCKTATRFVADIDFEWLESTSGDEELCPRVHIEVENKVSGTHESETSASG